VADRKIVRPRDAASLLLLRRRQEALEVLIGRRGQGARFMPGHYVFPGGRVGPGDARSWQGEIREGDGLQLALKRAALRETFEETGLVVGLKLAGGAPSGNGHELSPVEQAYRARGIMPAPDLLHLVGRAITPAISPIRFHARFFVADADHAAGELVPCEELNDLHWHPVGAEPPGPMQDVTRFMLRCAIAFSRAGAPITPPLFWHRGARSFVRDGSSPP